MSVTEKYTKLNTEKIPAVYEAGKKAEWSEFWDVVQDNGNRRNYYYAFCNDSKIWSAVTFKPKYDLICTSADHMFYQHGSSLPKFSLTELLKKNGCIIRHFTGY